MNTPKTFEMLAQRTLVIGACLVWIGPRLPKGYGTVGHAGKTWLTHRLSYTLTKGEIPAGYQVMHSCDNPSCINPEHLSVGTMKQNKQDCAAKGRCHKQGNSHCKEGHPYTDADWKKNGRGSKVRSCKLCLKAYKADLYLRKKAQKSI